MVSQKTYVNTDLAGYTQKYICVYTYKSLYVKAINGKEVMNLKEIRKECIREFGGQNGKQEVI